MQATALVAEPVCQNNALNAEPLSLLWAPLRQSEHVGIYGLDVLGHPPSKVLQVSELRDVTIPTSCFWDGRFGVFFALRV